MLGGYFVEKGKGFFEFGDLIVCELVLHGVRITRNAKMGRTYGHGLTG